MANLTHIMPCFIVSDFTTSIGFYKGWLGFEIRYIGPDEDPFLAIVGRDNISIMLKAIAPDVKPTPNRLQHQWAPWDAYIHAVDPDALYREYESAGVTFHLPLQVNTDNLRGFEVMDPDGYLLYFGKPKE